ncbi:eCIS core domain-containing protein [Streptomyces sp. CA-106110]|uniref:eCIS core domain-containing protein n=1 Tax=Streptomyces sp. CA-106110 TaxID=3240044 RepID=UPI003D9092CD
MGAQAYTSGNHVVIGEGGDDSHTLAHELTHVLQQRRGPVAGTDNGNGNGNGLRISDPPDRFEREAETNARQVMSGPAPAVQRSVQDAPAQRRQSAPAPVVQRMPSSATATTPELDLMKGATVRDMGGGFKKYIVSGSNPGNDPNPLFRGMRADEFAGLRSGALPQGGSYPGSPVG